MLDETKQNFAILLIKSSAPYELVELVKGKTQAELRVKERDEHLPQDQKDAGWKHFCDRTDVRLGTPLDVAQALREQECERRIYPTYRKKRPKLVDCW